MREQEIPPSKMHFIIFIYSQILGHCFLPLPDTSWGQMNPYFVHQLLGIVGNPPKYFTPIMENKKWCFPGFLWDFREPLCSGGAEVEEVIPVIPWNAADCIAPKL